MDPNIIIPASLSILDGILKVIAHAKEQGAITDDEIMAHAKASVPENHALIQQFLSSLPAKS